MHEIPELAWLCLLALAVGIPLLIAMWNRGQEAFCPKCGRRTFGKQCNYC